MRTEKAFECRMAADNSTLELLMYGPIGTDWWGDGSTVDAKAVAKALAANKAVKTIHLQVNSIGGDAFHGIAIYSALKNHGAKVIARIDGLAASAATVVVCAADEIEMNEAGLFMIHEAAWGTYGTVAEQQSILDATKKINEQSAAIYAARSGQTLSNVQAMMSATTWMTAQEAKDKGFVTSTKPLKTMSAAVQPGLFVNVPDHIKPILANLERKDLTMSTAPATPTPAAPVATAPTPAPAPAAPAVTAPAAPAPAAAAPAATAPAAAAPAVPVAQPVQMTAQQATERASGIAAACTLANQPGLAAKFIDDPNATVASVQNQLLAMLSASSTPRTDVTPNAGNPPPANPNAKFEAEYDAAAAVYAGMNITKEQYVKSRRVDEGLESLSLVPKK